MSKFKIGDVVVLNSGGPKMTIEFIEIKSFISGHLLSEPKYAVVWFDQKNEKQYGKFTESVLKLSE